MKKIVLRILRLFLGCLVGAIGTVMTFNANLGLGPWDVLSHGISKIGDVSRGKAHIAIGSMLLVSNGVLGERLGWGTIVSMVLTGIFMDFFMESNLIPIFSGFYLRILMLLIGLFIIGIGTYLYIGVGLGAGPRDGLMVALTRKTHKSVCLIRGIIEITAMAIGYFLGGFVGIGTIITALTIGCFVQLAFKLFKFDVKKVKSRFIDDDIRALKRKIDAIRSSRKKGF